MPHLFCNFSVCPFHFSFLFSRSRSRSFLLCLHQMLFFLLFCICLCVFFGFLLPLFFVSNFLLSLFSILLIILFLSASTLYLLLLFVLSSLPFAFLSLLSVSSFCFSDCIIFFFLFFIHHCYVHCPLLPILLLPVVSCFLLPLSISPSSSMPIAFLLLCFCFFLFSSYFFLCFDASRRPPVRSAPVVVVGSSEVSVSLFIHWLLSGHPLSDRRPIPAVVWRFFVQPVWPLRPLFGYSRCCGRSSATVWPSWPSPTAAVVLVRQPPFRRRSATTTALRSLFRLCRCLVVCLFLYLRSAFGIDVNDPSVPDILFICPAHSGQSLFVTIAL